MKRILLAGLILLIPSLVWGAPPTELWDSSSYPCENYQAGSQRGSGPRCFYVDSGAGAATTAPGGGSYGGPWSTLDFANDRCTDDRGDVIFLMPGHTETVTAAGGLDLVCTGMKVVFLGEGSNKARVNFTTAVTASLTVDGANIKLVNPRFTAGIDALTGPIDVNAAYFTIINGEYLDGTGIDTTDAIVADANADYMVIDGWRYLPGNEAGTQKQSNIQIIGADRPVLKNIQIFGSFATAPIENVSTAWVDAVLEDVTVGTSSAAGVPLTYVATARQSLSNVQLRDSTRAIGSTGDISLIGQITGGITGSIIFADTNNLTQTTAEYWTGKRIRMLTGPNAGQERPVVAFSAATDSITVEPGFAVTPLVAGERYAVVSGDIYTRAIGINDANNSFSSSLVASNRDGTILEREEEIADDTDALLALVGRDGGLAYNGTVDAAAAGSTTIHPIDDLIGLGDDFFNTMYDMCIVLNDGTPGGAPETECQDITDFANATGTVTTAAFTGLVQAGDEVIIRFNGIAALGENSANNVYDSTAVASNANGSILERQEFSQVTLGAPAGASVSADIAAVDVDTSALLVDTGDGADAEVLPGVAGSLHGHIREAQEDLGDGTDAVVAPGVAGSLHGHVREAQVQADSIQTDTTALLLLGNRDAGLAYNGTVDAAAPGSTTIHPIDDLIGLGDDFLNTMYDMCIVKNASTPGLAPETECNDITDFANATGTVTTAAFTVNVEASDEVIIRYHSIAAIGENSANNVFDSSAVASNANGSILERQEFSQVTLGAPAGASVSADIAAVDVDTSALLVDTGDGTDAVVAPGVAGSLHGHLREAQTQADSIQTDTSALLVDTGDGADAVVAPGVAGSLHGHLREAQTQADSIQTDTTALLVDTGDGADAAVGAGLAGSIHGHIRSTQEQQTDTNGRLGAGTDAVVAPGVAGSVQGHLREAQEQADLIQTDTTALLVDTGDGADAVVAPGVVGSLHGHIREAQTQADSIQTDTTALLVDTGDGTDAVVAPGVAGSLHGHLREAQTQADSIQTDTTALLVDTGDGADAEVLPGVVGSLHGHVREIQEDLGDGTDAAVAAGVAGSIHGHIRSLQDGAPNPGDINNILTHLRAGFGTPGDSQGRVDVSVDFTSVTWNTVATHEVITNTGTNHVKCFFEVTETLTDAANLATIQFGNAGLTTAWIAATGAAGSGGTTLDLGEMWIDNTPADTDATFGTAVFDRVVTGGVDLGYEIVGEAMLDGTIVFHCDSIPLVSGSTIAAGAGGVL